ncbi:MAG: hypothetical protein AAGB04_16525 [Pseudomonadota bacterium]
MIDRIGSHNVYQFPQPKQNTEVIQLSEKRSEESRQLAIKATQADHVKKVESALNAWMNFEASTDAKSRASSAQIQNAYGAV